MIAHKQYSTEPIQSWIVKKEDWNAFVKIERRNKINDNIYFGIGILILGVPALMVLRNSSFWIALAICLPLAILIPVLRMTIGSSYLKSTTKDTSILFYEDAIIANSKRIEINDQNKKWIKSLKIISSEDMPLLEFTIEWQTSKGRTFEEFRFPITDNYKNEVTLLIDRYKS